MQGDSIIARRFMEEVLSQGKVDAAGLFWEDRVELVPLPGQGPGLEGLKDVLRGLRVASSRQALDGPRADCGR